MTSLKIRSRTIDDVLTTAVENEKLVGAVVSIAQDGELVYSRAIGFADRERQKSIEMDSIFRLTSLSKTIVSAAALALIERGILHLEDDIRIWLPEFQPKLDDGTVPTITIRNLLTHTAGLAYTYLQKPHSPYARVGVSDGWDQVPAGGLSMTEELRRIASVPLSFKPGTQWQYSLGVDVLGEILARATNSSLAEVVESNVTRPLNMRDTGFNVIAPQRLTEQYADACPPKRMADPEFVPFLENGISFSPSRVFRSDSFLSGGGGVLGTSADYLILLETIRKGGNPIVPEHAARSMMANQIGELRVNLERSEAWGFGFGGSILLDPSQAGVSQSAGTWKWSGLYGHNWFVDPGQRLTVILLTNTAVEGMVGSSVDALQHAIYS